MGKRKEFVGVVVSDKMDKTRVVKIERLERHKRYKKVIRKFTKLKIHDQNNISRLGDTVRIKQSRPFSKGKHFVLVEVIKRPEFIPEELLSKKQSVGSQTQEVK
ncbi:MAG: 30S ribosomal protein S17 [Candidatus Omnitrophica bacterium]|nr:30S ribosomal protein S17 [Candidatus Omnitrophota bacterium]